MAIGNDFSSLAADQRGQQAQLASNYFQQLAAQRASAQIAQEAAARDRAFQLQQQQQADAEAAQRDMIHERESNTDEANQRFALDYLTGQNRNQFDQAAKEQELGLQQDYFGLKKDELDQQRQLRQDSVDNQGASLASELSNATQARQDAANKLNDLETYTAKLRQSALVNPMYKPRVVSILAGITDQMNDAKRNLAAADYMFKKTTGQAVNLGFMPDEAGGRIVHGRTGKSWTYLTPSSATSIDINSSPDEVNSFMDAGGSSAPTNYFQNRVQNLTPSVTPATAPSQPLGSSQMPPYLQQNTRVKVQSRDGRMFTVPVSQLDEAVAAGYTPTN